MTARRGPVRLCRQNRVRVFVHSAILRAILIVIPTLIRLLVEGVRKGRARGLLYAARVVEIDIR